MNKLKFNVKTDQFVELTNFKKAEKLLDIHLKINRIHI